MRMFVLFTGLVPMLLAVSTAVAQEEKNVIRDSFLAAIKDVNLPATEAGMLMDVAVEEGESVSEGQTLASIDDRQAKMAKRVAGHKYASARKQAENEISVEAAQRSHEVARAELDAALESNEKTPGAVPSTEVRRLRLQWQTRGLQIELAQFERLVAAIDARALWAEYEAADAMIERRQLTAPKNGFINRVFVSKGDWVQPGDPIMHIVPMDKLRVHGNLSASDYHPKNVLGMPVDIEIHLPGGQTETVRTAIAYASNVVQDDNTFRVWADIENPKEGKHWRFAPGMDATMILQD